MKGWNGLGDETTSDCKQNKIVPKFSWTFSANLQRFCIAKPFQSLFLIHIPTTPFGVTFLVRLLGVVRTSLWVTSVFYLYFRSYFLSDSLFLPRKKGHFLNAALSDAHSVERIEVFERSAWSYSLIDDFQFFYKIHAWICFSFFISRKPMRGCGTPSNRVEWKENAGKN